MAIFAYTGLMGHGKTYQAVKSVVVPKYKAGYNIKTNISGLNEENIKEYILKHDPEYDPKNFGTIHFFNEDDPQKDGFFPSEVERLNTETNELEKVVLPGICQPGDLIIVDEAWQYWDSGFSFPKNHINFFRYMRHFVNSKGHTSDLVIITQDISTIDRQLKKLVEMTFYTNKPKMLTSDRFNLTIYQGSSLRKTNMISHGTLPQKYDPEIFPLYKSYTQENAQEELVDGRIVFWKSKPFIFSMAFAFLLMALGLFKVISFFNGGAISDKSKKEVHSKEHDSTKEKGTPKGGTSSPIGTTPVPLSTPASTDKKITVLFYKNNNLIVGFKSQDKDSKTEYRFNPDCSGFGRFITCNIDNKKISF
ncbi:zonular occludens toxin domain-containing protein [Chitinivorax sp. PXF-14]|uniref:zonular occludens toxin domain-containing protein n=1 Tax=Chitinivorax sp. PXF-14 TaxID=3230488 RepID=UPI0034677ED0